MQRFLSILCTVSQIHPQYETGKTSNEVNTLLLIYEVSHICKVKTGLLCPEEVRWGENKLTKSKKNFMFCIHFALLPPSGQMWKALNKKCIEKIESSTHLQSLVQLLYLPIFSVNKEK